jgi:hypothetical protein
MRSFPVPATAAGLLRRLRFRLFARAFSEQNVEGTAVRDCYFDIGNSWFDILRFVFSSSRDTPAVFNLQPSVYSLFSSGGVSLLAHMGTNMKRICIVDVAGLSPGLLRSVPRLWMNGLAQAPSPMAPTFPAVSASVQASMTTGVGPGVHGIIAGGIYRRQSKAMSFEERSNTLLSKKRFWHAKDMPRGTMVSLVFWANSLAGAADFVLGANTYHCSDSQLLGQPMELYWDIRKALPPFDHSMLWGPGASWQGARWIAQAAGEIWREYRPDLQWVYLPGLNFEIVRHGLKSGEAAGSRSSVRTTARPAPADVGQVCPTYQLPAEVENTLAEMDAMVHELAHGVLLDGGEVIVVSDGGYVGVNHWALPNLRLREAGLLKVIRTPEGEAVDLENSQAVAMVDHQVGHLFVDESVADAAARAVAADPAVAAVVPRDELFAPGLGHDRCGERIILAKNDAWLAPQWWDGRAGSPSRSAMPARQDDQSPADAGQVCPTYHCGYDPTELFADTGVDGGLSLVRASRGLVSPDPLDGCVFASTDGQAKAPPGVTDLPGTIREMMLGR